MDDELIDMSFELERITESQKRIADSLEKMLPLLEAIAKNTAG